MFQTLATNLNKYPCEGPKTNKVSLTFANSDYQEIDLFDLTYYGKVSLIQSLFVDNTDNPDRLFIVCAVTGQRIAVPANAQGYVNIVGQNPPKFYVGLGLTPAAPVSISIQTLNFPTNSLFWPKEIIVPPVQYATWDASNKSAGISLIGDDLTANRNGTLDLSNALVVANSFKDSGRHYVEFLINEASISPFALIGIVPMGFATNSFPGATIDSYGYYQQDGNKYNNNVGSAYGSSYTNGDVVMLDINLDAGEIRAGKNGVYADSGNPMFTGISGMVAPALSLFRNGASITARFNPISFSYAPPVGATPGWTI